MTSSEDNRVSIPLKRSGTLLTDDRSCVSSRQMAFDSVDLNRFFCWKLAPVHLSHTSTHCQIYYSGVLVLWVSAAESMSNLG